MFALPVRLVRIGIEVLFPFRSIWILSQLVLLVLHDRALLRHRHSLFLSSSFVNHVEFFNINTFNIEFDCGSIGLFFTRLCDCRISLNILRLGAFTSSQRYSIRCTVVGFGTSPMRSESRPELIKLRIVILEQQRTLLFSSSLHVFLLGRPKILFGVVSSFSDLLFMFAYDLPVRFAYSFCPSYRGSISRP